MRPSVRGTWARPAATLSRLLLLCRVAWYLAPRPSQREVRRLVLVTREVECWRNATFGITSLSMRAENPPMPKLALRLGLPLPVARWLPSKPWLSVEVSETPWIAHAGNRDRLELHRVASSIDDQQLADLASRLLSQRGDRLDVIVSRRLRASARAFLEGMGAAYLDGSGSLHLPHRGGLIHIESEKSAVREGARTPGLGPSGVRAVQVLLDSSEPQALARISESAALSLAQTHAVLRLLEQAGMVRTTGIGPARRRTILDRGTLLEWLAGQAPARRREPRLDVSIYARRPEDLWKHIAGKLGGADVDYAMTGAAATALHRAGPTAVPLTAVRISPDISLDRASTLLGAEKSDRGANVRLLKDTGRVGTVGAEELAGVRVAQRVRVYLDALDERRGADIAQHFREVILGY